MTGRIIPFESYRTCKAIASPRRSRHQSASRPMRSQADFGSSVRTRNLKLQLARITELLDDLEQLGRASSKFPPEIASQGHAGMESASKLLLPCSGSEPNAGAESDIEDDPQPAVDDEVLERMYSELNPDA
jgi:hypothetical protein